MESLGLSKILMATDCDTSPPWTPVQLPIDNIDPDGFSSAYADWQALAPSEQDASINRYLQRQLNEQKKARASDAGRTLDPISEAASTLGSTPHNSWRVLLLTVLALSASELRMMMQLWPQQQDNQRGEKQQSSKVRWPQPPTQHTRRRGTVYMEL